MTKIAHQTLAKLVMRDPETFYMGVGIPATRTIRFFDEPSVALINGRTVEPEDLFNRATDFDGHPFYPYPNMWIYTWDIAPASFPYGEAIDDHIACRFARLLQLF